MESSIVTIRLKMGDVEVEMSLADAKSLFETLETLFGRNTEYIPQPYISPVRPYKIPYTPWRREPYAIWYGDYTCNNGTATIPTGISSARLLEG